MGSFIVAVAVWSAVIVGGWLGGRGLERAFRQLGEYSAGPRPYPDQDPAPARRERSRV